MVDRDFKKDLEQILKDTDTISEQVIAESKRIYSHYGLMFDDSAFRSVRGDLCVKVLGKYLGSVLHCKPEYEVRLVGRMRADIELCNKIEIEVKSHGMFDESDLKKRFRVLTDKKREMKHIYVAFRERQDFVGKTRKALSPLGVDCFFLSTYVTGEKPVICYNDLRSLVNKLSSILGVSPDFRNPDLESYSSCRKG